MCEKRGSGLVRGMLLLRARWCWISPIRCGPACRLFLACGHVVNQDFQCARRGHDLTRRKTVLLVWCSWQISVGIIPTPRFQKKGRAAWPEVARPFRRYCTTRRNAPLSETFLVDERVCEFFLRVGVVYVRGFEDGATAQVLEDVHGQE